MRRVKLTGTLDTDLVGCVAWGSPVFGQRRTGEVFGLSTEVHTEKLGRKPTVKTRSASADEGAGSWGSVQGPPRPSKNAFDACQGCARRAFRVDVPIRKESPREVAFVCSSIAKVYGTRLPRRRTHKAVVKVPNFLIPDGPFLKDSRNGLLRCGWRGGASLIATPSDVIDRLALQFSGRRFDTLPITKIAGGN